MRSGNQRESSGSGNYKNVVDIGIPSPFSFAYKLSVNNERIAQPINKIRRL